MPLTRDRFVWVPWWNACGRSAGHVAAAWLVCALLCTPARAADEPPAPPAPMIPPGQEELLATLLGRGVALAGCEFTAGEVIYTTVKATYACPGGETAVFELSHPSTADRSAIQTAQFAITLLSGSPPRSLADALVSSIRAREDAFEWEQPPAPPAAEADEGNAGE